MANASALPSPSAATTAPSSPRGVPLTKTASSFPSTFPPPPPSVASKAPKLTAPPSKNGKSKGPAKKKKDSSKAKPKNPSAAGEAAEENGENDEEMDDPDADQLYCQCRTPYDPDRDMIMCEAANCQEWFHIECIGMSEEDVEHCDVYFCPKCEAAGRGRTRFKAMSKRARRDKQQVNYNETMAEDHIAHAEASRLAEKIREIPDAHFPILDGERLTSDYIRRHGWSQPLLVPAAHRHELGMSMPQVDEEIKDPKQRWSKLCKLILDGVGADVATTPFRVATQAETEPLSFKQWVDYLLTPPALRKKLLNLISLEISGTPLGDSVERPSIVREFDWIDYFWPPEADVQDASMGMPWPKVQLYCLMSPADSYTDWHVDFGGSSVFYHVLQGEKTFLFVPPSGTNLRMYEQWANSPLQSTTFFSDHVSTKYKITVRGGDTLFIPSGWLHAVSTTEDSIVIGGNFIHTLGIQTQIKVYEMEARTGVDPRFRFPWWERLHWYAAHWYACQAHTSAAYLHGLTNLEVDNLHALSSFLLRRLDLWQQESQVGESGDHAAQTKGGRRGKYTTISMTEEAQLVKQSIPPEFETMQYARNVALNLQHMTKREQTRRDPAYKGPKSLPAGRHVPHAKEATQPKEDMTENTAEVAPEEVTSVVPAEESHAAEDTLKRAHDAPLDEEEGQGADVPMEEDEPEAKKVKVDTVDATAPLVDETVPPEQPNEAPEGIVAEQSTEEK